LTIRDDLSKLLDIYIKPDQNLDDMIHFLGVSGKMTHKSLQDMLVICIKHIEELENNAASLQSAKI